MVDRSRVPEFYRNYVEMVGDGQLVPTLLRSGDEFMAFCKRLTEQQGNYRYAEDKWSIKEIILHLIDSERVFAYRALRFARNDTTELSGFDQDHFVQESNANNRTIHGLLTEFTNVRAATIDLFSSFSDEVRKRSGKSNDVEMSVELLGLIISGHVLHHLKVISERYTS